MSTFEEITIPVPWGQIAGKAWNDRTGKPVLMVHGILDNAASFDKLVPLLPEDFYFVSIDMPGHGKSSPFFRGVPVKFFDFVLAMDYIADFFKWDKFIYIGHSAGGYIGFFYCAMFPERVAKFIALDEPIRVFSPQTGVQNLLSSYGKAKDTEILPASGEPVCSYKAAIQRIIISHPDGISVGSAVILAKRCLIQSGNGYKFSTDARMRVAGLSRMNIEQTTELLKRIKCPVLAIAASKSISSVPMKGMYEETEPIREMLKRNLGDSYRFHTVEGNHSVHTDYPERISDLVSEFLVI